MSIMMKAANTLDRYSLRYIRTNPHCNICYINGHFNTVNISEILITGFHHNGELTCPDHRLETISKLKKFEEDNCIFDLSDIITDTELIFPRVNIEYVSGYWCLEKYTGNAFIYDGIGTTFLSNTGSLAIRIGNYPILRDDNTRIIMLRVSFQEFLEVNNINPLSLNLPQYILDKLDISSYISNSMYQLKFVD